jgi:methionyl aminopeptidase
MIFLKSPEEIEKMSASGRLVAEILSEIRRRIKPGVTTQELDLLAARTEINGRRYRQLGFWGLSGWLLW